MFCCQSATRVNVIKIELQCSACGTSEIRMVTRGENVFEKGVRFEGFGECFP